MYWATYIHQHKARRRLLLLRPPPRTHRSRRTPRVNEELALHLICLEPVRAAPEQHIYIHLPCRYQQAVAVSRRYDGVPMREAYAQTTMRDDF